MITTPTRALRRSAAGLALAALLAGCQMLGPMPTPTPVPDGMPAPGPAPAPAPVAVPAPKLAGSSWYWLGTLTPAGLVAPADPGAFNLEFLDGGQLAAQLDCNTGGAS
ncbi:MAG: hypothetical protein ACOYLX_19330, partial [Burkholderiaceae bacterium]